MAAKTTETAALVVVLPASATYPGAMPIHPLEALAKVVDTAQAMVALPLVALFGPRQRADKAEPPAISDRDELAASLAQRFHGHRPRGTSAAETLARIDRDCPGAAARLRSLADAHLRKH